MSTIIKHQRYVRAEMASSPSSIEGEQFDKGRAREVAGKVAVAAAITLAAAGLGLTFHYGLEHSDMYGRQHDVPEADQPSSKMGVETTSPVELTADN